MHVVCSNRTLLKSQLEITPPAQVDVVWARSRISTNFCPDICPGRASTYDQVNPSKWGCEMGKLFDFDYINEWTDRKLVHWFTITYSQNGHPVVWATLSLLYTFNDVWIQYTKKSLKHIVILWFHQVNHLEEYSHRILKPKLLCL